ncbi:MAG: hypothetical protein ACK5E6_01085 [Cyanobacteriota bacterium]|jgi:DNA-binding transcriptional ArsR family regulator
MGSVDDHGQRVRQGLRRAAQGGSKLGGLRPATDRSNRKAHMAALQEALRYRKVLEAGRDKSLSALSRDLFAAGCRSGSGKPLTPEMVRRLRARLEEAKLAIADGVLEGELCSWDPVWALTDEARKGNASLFLWYLRMARKDCGEAFANRLIEQLLRSEHADWVRATLAIS